VNSVSLERGKAWSRPHLMLHAKSMSLVCTCDQGTLECCNDRCLLVKIDANYGEGTTTLRRMIPSTPPPSCGFTLTWWGDLLRQRMLLHQRMETKQSQKTPQPGRINLYTSSWTTHLRHLRIYRRSLPHVYMCTAPTPPHLQHFSPPAGESLLYSFVCILLMPLPCEPGG
jgi:hypothetical protein